MTAILIIAVGAEGYPHCLEIKQQLIRFYRLCYLDAKARIVAETACGINVKLSVRTRGIAHIAECRMGYVFRRIGKANLELARHRLCVDKVHCKFTDCLCIRQNVEIFALLHAAERCAHGVAREIAAAAHGDNADIQSAFHDVAGRFCIHIVQLNGLTRGKVRARHIVLADGFGNVCELLRGHTASRHTQTQHVFRRVMLCIAAIAAGKAFVFRFFYFALGVCNRFFAEQRHIRLPALRVNLLHNNSSLWRDDASLTVLLISCRFLPFSFVLLL